ncbi:HlyD family efflux transporter periplasmic adaptor subunit [Caenimonas terrae]|uniref:HlyD family efflux transporter periplasmic adaptor subunit n=1 Tax=Caenimonas terrae TaxID=696074 RepID=A0ABW0NGK0_9BURK
MITREPNSKRKSLRVAIPLYVEIGGATYGVSNWSTTGIGVVGLQEEPEPGSVVPARISFPMLESTLTIAVELKFRARHDEVYGFDFHELSARNKRVLRHYIELSVDGKLGDVEDIVAVASSPVTVSPIELPLNLAQPAPHGTLQGFRKRNYAAVVLGFAVIAAVASLLFYNFAYKIEGTGFVNGSIERVTANYDGRLAKVLATPQSFVEANAPLFTVENPAINALKTEVDLMEQQLAVLTREQNRVQQARLGAEAGLLSSLKQDSGLREQELSNARKLFENGVISQVDLMKVAADVSDQRNNYLRQVAEGASRTATFESGDQLARMRIELAAKKMLLARQATDQTVRAPRKGKVFAVDKVAGEYVSARDPVVLLESDITPSVLLRLPNDDALKLRLGMPATVYVPFEDRRYPATISAIGLAAVNAASLPTMEGGLNETLIKLEFDDKKVRLPANARVTVWVRTLGNFGGWI